MKTIYNKLVRDKIPSIIERDGKQCKVILIEGEVLKLTLKNKLHEELKEYQMTNNDKESKEELADILEIIDALSAFHNSSLQEILQIKEDKKNKRGGFEKGIVLISVDE